jgi:hypothetical protein
MTSEANYIVKQYSDTRIFANNIPNACGMYRKLKAMTWKNRTLTSKEIATKVLIGKCYLRGNFLRKLLAPLIASLNGETITLNRIFIKQDWFGKEIFNSAISLYATPKRSVDDEGSISKNKYIVKNGVLLNCYNNIRSASLLCQQPGNATFNYLTGNMEISPDEVAFSHNNKLQYINDCTVADDVIDMTVNSETGSTSFGITYTYNNSLFQYTINAAIIDILNGIIGSYGKAQNFGILKLPGVVIDFRLIAEIKKG